MSIIIPVYNAKQYLQRCLNSVYAQSHENLEIIAIDDGSTDGSSRILERNAAQDPRLRVISQENRGQGVARNRALAEAAGEFVLFVDADDFIEPRTVELTLARAIKDESDFVHFDWKLASRLRHRPKAYNYFNIRNIWTRSILQGAECDELMDTVSFFSVISLYRRAFLDEHNIRFGEGYVYEDNPFYVLCANRATRVSLLHSPLYVVQPSANSTTQSNVNTDRHALGHLKAIRASLARIESRSPATLTYFAKYHLQKFMEYYGTRVPAEHRAAYARGFVQAFSDTEIVLDPSIPVNRYLKYFVRSGTFTKMRVGTFQRVIDGRHRLVPGTKKRIAQLRRQKHSILDRKRPVAPEALLPAQAQKLQGAFLFLGFDHRFSGNSRYLWEEISKDPRFREQPRFFVTDDPRVEESERISPSDHGLLWAALRSAAVVLAESWVPLSYPKSPESVWIQLWHGTPLKKVLFDSAEREIISHRIDHKVLKHRDIQKWDFLVSDSDFATQTLSSAFLFPSERILQTGYPRVRYLRNARIDRSVRHSIRERLGIAPETRVIVYAPTWRDYNYGLEDDQMDWSFSMDLGQLSAALPADSVILFHAHNYMPHDETVSTAQIIDASEEDIQDLLTIADGVISDYSSLIFDCFAAAIPVALYCTDEERFLAGRGIYPEAWEALEPIKSRSTTEAVSMLISPPSMQTEKAFLDHYAFKERLNLIDFLDTLDLTNLGRDW
ncbi:CDP-glycerol glycerophosphotransferase family protein [Leucobacter chromiireducens]|uniref:CDP-glycerol glycerophosphotransferase family protein n=1 Tax=Leucobacter chromiireducens TaxID=283877 RepID=UPI0019297B20